MPSASLEALMRNAFIAELVAQAEKNPKIALVVGDLGYSVVEEFADKFPDRFINAGVAEQNMTGLAAGMASEGYQVFTYSIANFPTFRCAEQIRNDIDYMRLPVTVVTVGGGLAYGALGYSHHAVQDYALIRCMPNMLIAAPGDPVEVRACVRYLIENPQPSYLRLGKAGEPTFRTEGVKLAPGRWLPLDVDGAKVEGARRAILTTGATLEMAVQAKRDHSEYSDDALFSMPLWGMASKADQFAQCREFDEIIAVEDHLHDGGFGSWLSEALSSHFADAPRVRSLSLAPSICGEVGSQQFLNRSGGLTFEASST
jgi:transketolase